MSELFMVIENTNQFRMGYIVTVCHTLSSNTFETNGDEKAALCWNKIRCNYEFHSLAEKSDKPNLTILFVVSHEQFETRSRYFYLVSLF